VHSCTAYGLRHSIGPASELLVFWQTCSLIISAVLQAEYYRISLLSGATLFAAVRPETLDCTCK
jgi:hypothetical protein